MEFFFLWLGYFLLAYLLCCLLVGISVFFWHCTCKKRGDRIATLKVAQDRARCVANLEKFLLFYVPLAEEEKEVPSCNSNSNRREIDEMDDGMNQKQREEKKQHQFEIIFD